jgi:diguanylate cyclase (GGDEF)-like protein
MPLVTAAEMMNKKPAEVIRDNPRLKEKNIYINYYGNLKKFTTVPAWKIFKENKEYLTKILKDKVVFVGTSTEIIHDTYPTPMGIMSGVVITMNEAIGYATGDFLYPAGKNTNFVLILIFVFAAILAMLWLRPIQGMILFAIDLIVFFAFSLIAFSHKIIVDYFGVLFLVIFSALFFYTYKYVMMILENAELKREAVTDGLTQLYVYRYFELCLKKELKKANEGRGKLALVFYDIDHFKRINDTYGHEFGNVVLRTIARTLKDNTRSINTLARYGGEEFCVLMPQTSAKEVMIYAERIRNAIKNLEFKTDKGETVNITISGGIVTSEHNENITQYTNFVKAADSALYRSKETGRDKVRVFDAAVDTKR